MCPHYNIMTDESYAHLKSSIFYLFMMMMICPLVFWAKFSERRNRFLTYENFFFLFWLIFFIVATTKAFNYRSILTKREYLRNLEFRELLYEEEMKLNKKFAHRRAGDQYAKIDDDDSHQNHTILPQNVLIKLDYREKSLFKEVVIRIQDKTKMTDT